MDKPTLSHRPRAETFAVEDILSYAQQGRLRLPSFQTGLRWEGRHVRELFDSILRGFPVGSLLLWRRPVPAAKVCFGPVVVDAPGRTDGLMIVDGQQRVSALVGALRHPSSRPLAGPFAVWVNLLDQTLTTPRSAPEGPEWIPLNVLGDYQALVRWSVARHRAGQETEELLERASELSKRILKYTLPAYTVEEGTPEALRLIFARVNHSGVPLGEAQVFNALFEQHEQTQPLKAMQRALADATGFGKISEDWLLRCIKSVRDPNPRRELSEANPLEPALLERTQRALGRACQFIVEEAELPHVSLLPYQGPLVVLARFFDQHEDPSPRDRALLVRWLWRGALSGVHANTSHEVMSRQLGDIGEDPSETVQALLARVPRDPQRPALTGRWYGQAARTRIVAATLCERLLQAGHLRREELQQQLSRAPLGELFTPLLPELQTELAARAWRWKRPDTQLELGLPPEHLGALLLDEDMLACIQSGDGKSLLALRRIALDEALASTIERRAAPGANDRPAIAVILRAVAP